jgi:prepilin-type processing-associated H-X9-DG protein
MSHRGGIVVGWADGHSRPAAASLRYTPGGAAAAAALIPVGADGAIDLYNSGPSAITLIVDLTGGYCRYPSIP